MLGIRFLLSGSFSTLWTTSKCLGEHDGYGGAASTSSGLPVSVTGMTAPHRIGLRISTISSKLYTLYHQGVPAEDKWVKALQKELDALNAELDKYEQQRE